MKNKTLLYGGMVAMQALIYGMGNAVTKIAYESITPFLEHGIAVWPGICRIPYFSLERVF